jgi:hypothetical protein
VITIGSCNRVPYIIPAPDAKVGPITHDITFVFEPSRPLLPAQTSLPVSLPSPVRGPHVYGAANLQLEWKYPHRQQPLQAPGTNGVNGIINSNSNNNSNNNDNGNGTDSDTSGNGEHNNTGKAPWIPHGIGFTYYYGPQSTLYEREHRNTLQCVWCSIITRSLSLLICHLQCCHYHLHFTYTVWYCSCSRVTPLLHSSAPRRLCTCFLHSFIYEYLQPYDNSKPRMVCQW